MYCMNNKKKSDACFLIITLRVYLGGVYILYIYQTIKYPTFTHQELRIFFYTAECISRRSVHLPILFQVNITYKIDI